MKMTTANLVDFTALTLRVSVNGTPTETELDDAIEKTVKMQEALGNSVPEETRNEIKRILQARLVINMDIGVKIIDNNTYRPWLANRKAYIDEYYWNRYRKYLLDEKRWADTVVDTLDKDGDEILDLMGDPQNTDPWRRKGLVLGDIQSGKTSTYLAIMNKAADAGYKLIILLSGTIEALRKQTQERIDEGFIGLNSRNALNKDIEKKYVGVGLFDKQRTGFPLTDIISDFDIRKLQALNFSAKSLNEPIVFVVKKNVTVLKNLYQWINNSYKDTAQEQIAAPLLLIDDEADNASVNTKKPDLDPTAINRSIRQILHLFSRSTYLAVTATPFANIFINPDDDKESVADLFPSDFIYSLSAPDNYFGSSALFGENTQYDDCLETITDAEGVFKSAARASHNVSVLPDSLKDAIGYFLLCNAVRDRRGITNDHRSMLINISPYTLPQESVYDIVDIYLDRIQKDIKAYSKLGPASALNVGSIDNLRRIWSEYGLQVKAECSFETILETLTESTLPIKINMVNTKSKVRGFERLDYKQYKENGHRVIVVGGNSLSRGITLEGLCVSYFYRDSKMYDTLLQMGRWFGYRPGYADLVKVWMSERTIDWFEFINEACEELRSEILYMNRLGQTPSEFGLKVLENPDTLMITANNKMRTAKPVERWISLSGKLVETPWLSTHSTDFNFNLTTSLVSELLNEYQPSPRYPRLYSGIPSNRIAEYVGNFVSHPGHLIFNAREIGKYIEDNADALIDWHVYIPDGSDDEDINFSGLNLKRIRRGMDLDNKGCIRISGNKSRVGSTGAVKVLLNKETQDEALEAYKEYLKSKGRYSSDKKLTVPDHIYLRFTDRPILIIYAMKYNPDSKGNPAPRELVDKTIVGLSLGFPRTDVPEKKAYYKINMVEQKNLMPEFFTPEDYEEEEDED